jgi:hypothetical protein
MGKSNHLAVSVQPWLPRHGGSSYQLLWSFFAPTKPLFPLGQVIATPAAINQMEEYGLNGADLLARHQSGDWGDVSEADKQSNELAVQRGLTVRSRYGKGDDFISVSTYEDRSTTHLLVPSCDLYDT